MNTTTVIDALIGDVLRVATFVLRRTRARSDIRTEHMRYAIEAAARDRDFPSLAVLHYACRWVENELCWRDRRCRGLTADERAAHNAAKRLLAAMNTAEH